MVKEKNSRQRVRSPEAVKAFCGRLATLLAETHTRQAQLAKDLGGFAPQLISRLVSGAAQTIPADFLVQLAEWADTRNVSLRWLFMGAGAIRKGADVPEAVRATNEVAAFKMVAALAERAGVDISDVMTQTDAMVYVPDTGFVHLNLNDALAHLAAEIGPAETSPGYETVAAEAVPTTFDWHTKYVPVLGRIAAGEGEDIAEAQEYPPFWAGEFLVYGNAPPSAVAVRVSGRSMEPRFHDGDMVIVDPDLTIETGEIGCVIVEVDGQREARLKRLKLTPRVAILESLNRDFEAVRMSRSRLLAAYKVVDHLPLLRRIS